jgi:dihydroneopterin aldolase/D-erythro-7,8-dihydroneopterin triphosphate epimerase
MPPMNESPLDRIYIRDLLLRCIIGIFPEERREKQDVIINITLGGDMSRAGQTDNIEDAIDYKNIKKRVLAMAQQSSFFLIERLAEQIAAICLENPMVLEVRVSVEKPGALRFARSVGVEMTRRQPRNG